MGGCSRSAAAREGGRLVTTERQVLATAPLAAEALAQAFVAGARQAIRQRGTFGVALSGGATPRALYRRLAAPPFAAQVEWPRVQVFWGDERCVPPDHEASNYRMARESLLEHVPLPAENVHRIRGEDDPSKAAAGYQEELRTVLGPQGSRGGGLPPPVLDLVLLGLGLDGHTASLFPGRPVPDGAWVHADYAPAVAMWRITLTPLIINAATEVAFLVTGPEKAGIVHRVLDGPRRPEQLPAQRIVPSSGRLRWFLDAAAATELSDGPLGQR